MHHHPHRKTLQRTLLVIAIACSSVGAALAQSNYYIEDEKTFYGGLIAGGNFTQVDGDNFAGYNKAGFNVGGVVYIKLDERVAASIEVLYTQKGARSVEPYLISNGQVMTKYGVTLNYAEVPLLINYFDKRKSHFGGGFSYGRLATVKESMVTSPPLPITLDDYPFKKSDFNLVLNGNLHVWKGFFFNLRFQYSLVSIRTLVPQINGRGTQFNNMWVMRVMYLFN